MATSGTHGATPVEEQILRQQVALIYNRAPVLILGIVIAASAFVYIFRNKVSQDFALTWLGVFLVISLARAVLVAVYRRRSEVGLNPRFWRHAFPLGSMLSGTCWGAG